MELVHCIRSCAWSHAWTATSGVATCGQSTELVNSLAHGHGPVVPLSCRVNRRHLTGAASQQSGNVTQLTVTRTPNPGPGPGNRP